MASTAFKVCLAKRKSCPESRANLIQRQLSGFILEEREILKKTSRRWAVEELPSHVQKQLLYRKPGVKKFEGGFYFHSKLINADFLKTLKK